MKKSERPVRRIKGNKKSVDGTKITAYYEPQSKREQWLVGIACVSFFPMVYLIGRAIIYLFG